MFLSDSTFNITPKIGDFIKISEFDNDTVYPFKNEIMRD